MKYVFQASIFLILQRKKLKRKCPLKLNENKENKQINLSKNTEDFNVRTASVFSEKGK